MLNRELRSKCIRTLVPALMLMAAAVQIRASITAQISGTVKDPSGAAVPGVSLTVTNEDTGVHVSTQSDGRGFFIFPSLPVGNYDLEARQTGFRAWRETGLHVDVNTALTADVNLELGQEVQSVTVGASAVQVETSSSQMGEVISEQKMTTVPLNGRSYTDLLALQPGVVPVSSGEYGAVKMSGDLNPGSLSVSGQRESANGFMVNGANVEEGTSMGTAVIPNLDSIAEFRILTNNFDAEYGNYSGGQVNAITKSGTNQFHGDAFEFLRNTDLDARNFFSPDRGAFIQNQFGGTFGGPIIHDKLFFFTDYQETRQILGQSTGEIQVPSLDDRNGNLTDMASQLTGTVNGSYWANQLSQKLGYPVTAGEAYYTPGCTTSAACVFPNATIPASVISAPAQALLKYIPAPNDGPYYSTSAYNQILNDGKGSFRIDSNSRFGMISGYYFIDDYTLNNPYASSTLPGFNAITPGRSQMANASDTATFGPTMVNEFRLNFTRFAYFNNEPSGGVGPSLSSLGFETGANMGIVPLAPQIEGVPPINFNDYSIGVPAYTMAQYNNTYQLIDNFTKVKGSHTFKFGADVHYDQITEHDFGANNGTFGFSGVETGSDFADFLIGAPAYYDQGEQEPLHSRAKYIGLFAQDSWHVKSNLTLNYGLRWEVTSPWYEAQGEFETIVPGLQSQVFPGAPTGWVVPGDPGIPKTLAPTRYDNFAPRVGLAYSPDINSGLPGKLTGGPGKTSIRAGYGIFYTAFEDAAGFVETGDAPFGLFWASPTPPLFSQPFIDRATGNVEGQRFPVPFPPAGASASNPDTSVNWAQFLPISGSPAFWHGNRVPYAEDYSLSIERQLGGKSVLQAAYVGTEGHALLSSVESNPGNPALCLSLSQPSEVAANSATCGPFGENGVYTRANGTVVNGTRFPLGNNFGSDQLFMTMGNSNYNSLQVTYRYTSGPLGLLAGYTYSKAIDDASGYQDQVNPLNYALSRALSAFDMTHNFVASFQYTLPFAHWFGDHRLSSGWILSGITRFSTGLPVTLTETDDQSLLGVTSAGTVDEPNYTPGNLEFNNPRSGLPYFNTALFSQEALGQLGTADRRFFYGPGIENVDAALLKDTHLTESVTLQLRFEFFNVFNHAQFMNPTGNIDSSTFGYVTSARDPRIGQVAMKILF